MKFNRFIYPCKCLTACTLNELCTRAQTNNPVRNEIIIYYIKVYKINFRRNGVLELMGQSILNNEAKGMHGGGNTYRVSLIVTSLHSKHSLNENCY